MIEVLSNKIVLKKYRIELLYICIFLVFAFISTIYPGKAYPIELTLHQAIKAALRNNFGLQVEVNELENRIAEITKQKADFIPRFDLNLSYTRLEDQPVSEDISIENRDYSASIIQKLPLGGELSLSFSSGIKSSSSYQLDETITISGEDEYSSEFGIVYTHHLLKDGLFGPAFVAIKEASYDRQIQNIALDEFKIDMVSKVKAVFYQLIRQQKAMDVNKEILKISENVLELIRLRNELGLSPEIDVMRARIELNRSREVLLISRQGMEEAGKELQNLLGIDDKVKALDQLDVKRTLPTVKKAVSIALVQNQQLLQLKKQIEKQCLAVKVAGNHILPMVDLFTGFKKFGGGDSFESAGDLEGKEYQTGLKVSYPFYNISLTKNYHQRKRDLKKLKLKLRELEIQIINLTAALTRQLYLLEDRVSIFRDQLKIIRERLDIALKAFDHGLISIDRLYDARDDLLEVENQYLSLLLERRQKWAAFQALMGKGYSKIEN